MHGKELFEYSVIRVVPRVERGEFLNIGVVMYCAKIGFLNAVFKIDEERVHALSNDLAIKDLQQYVTAFSGICKGGPESGSIGQLPVAERFRWLTATRSTILQSSPVHNGLTENCENELDRLFRQMVL